MNANPEEMTMNPRNTLLIASNSPSSNLTKLIKANAADKMISEVAKEYINFAIPDKAE